MNFNTVATPHIGMLRYSSILSSLTSALGSRLLSRTGEQFYCIDKWSSTGRPLLEVLADPSEWNNPTELALALNNENRQDLLSSTQ